jgi:hypothetical protein
MQQEKKRNKDYQYSKCKRVTFERIHAVARFPSGQIVAQMKERDINK